IKWSTSGTLAPTFSNYLLHPAAVSDISVVAPASCPRRWGVRSQGRRPYNCGHTVESVTNL
ncbi:MAG: hypothetical protein ACRD3W_28305, partial [Terriglobales bacterium]